MSEEIPSHEQDIRYLYENALAQIHSMARNWRADNWPIDGSDRVVTRIKELSNAALMHDFKSVYPGHTEEFHQAIKEREARHCDIL